MPNSRAYIVLGIGRKRPLLRDTLATTSREAKILAVNSMLRDRPGEDCTWRMLHSWGYECVSVTVSYKAPHKS